MTHIEYRKRLPHTTTTYIASGLKVSTVVEKSEPYIKIDLKEDFLRVVRLIQTLLRLK